MTPNNILRIALDGMGSDEYPFPELQGATQATTEFGCQILITGDRALLEPALSQLNNRNTGNLIRIVHAPDRVEMAASPAFSSRSKAHNTIACGIQLLRDGKVDAFVSAGNTGAILANGLFILGRLQNARRPALTVLLPIPTGSCVFLDVGANSDCKPEYLQQFAVMGTVYAQTVLGIRSPRVALLSNGEEQSKGNQLVKDAHAILIQNTELNFIGNIEAKEMLSGAAYVVVTDGFTGNVALKTTEATAGMVKEMLRHAMRSTLRATLGGSLAKTAIRSTLRPLDPNEHGGAPLLGLNGVVIVAHGRSNAHGIRSAIGAARKAIRQNMLPKMQARITKQLGTRENPNE
ncbi:MAG: phosphate acyltransferase PlsX [Anaerolineales bacterium]|nr:phosphate acyltransferase PlsX [Anaerolineales bacterium]